VGAQDLVLVLDFGSQYSQLIARRVREAGVYCELIAGTTPWETIRHRNPSALILSGGPASVYEEGAPRCDPAALAAGVPVLGICYGMQLLAYQLGGKVALAPLIDEASGVAATEQILSRWTQRMPIKTARNILDWMWAVGILEPRAGACEDHATSARR